MKVSEKTTRITLIALYSALATLLYFVELPFVVAFYKIDLSGIPVLLAGFTLGPLAGFIVILIKNLLHLTVSYSMGVGELADLLMLGTMMLVSSLYYRKSPNFRGAAIGVVLGTLAMAVMGGLVNYFILIPFYVNVATMMTMDDIVALGGSVFAWVDSLPKLIVAVTIPFNLLKGAVIGGVTLVLMKYLKPLMAIGPAGRKEMSHS